MMGRKDLPARLVPLDRKEMLVNLVLTELQERTALMV